MSTKQKIHNLVEECFLDHIGLDQDFLIQLESGLWEMVDSEEINTFDIVGSSNIKIYYTDLNDKRVYVGSWDATGARNS